MAQKIPGTKVLDETFKKTVTAVAVPLGHNEALAFVTKFMTDATTNGTLRKAYDNNGLKDAPIRTEQGRRADSHHERGSKRLSWRGRSEAVRPAAGIKNPVSTTAQSVSCVKLTQLCHPRCLEYFRS